MSSGLAVIGLNHKTAPVEVREKVTFSSNRDGSLTRSILALPGVREAIILSTCNRSEVIAQCDPVEEVVHHILKAIADLNEVNHQSLAKHSYVKIGSDAVKHVFRVASSLDSMILGEPQILGHTTGLLEPPVRGTHGNPKSGCESLRPTVRVVESDEREGLTRSIIQLHPHGRKR